MTSSLFHNRSFCRGFVRIATLGLLTWLSARDPLDAQCVEPEYLIHDIRPPGEILARGCLTADGLKLYYLAWSEEKGSYLLATARKTRFATFGPGVELGPEINDPNAGENFPCVSPDGTTLYFSAGGLRGGAGQQDIWVARTSTPDDVGAPFQEVFRITDPAINTGSKEQMGCLSADETWIFFTRDHWQLYMAKFNTPGRPEHGFSDVSMLNVISLPPIASKWQSLSPCGKYFLWSDCPNLWQSRSDPRPGGNSPITTDVWIARRDRSLDGSRWLEFSHAMSLPAPVNTAQHEIAPWISYDGLSLFVVSDRRQYTQSLSQGELLEFKITGDLGCFYEPPSRVGPFLRGECNDDGKVDISDAVCILGWLFLGKDAPGCVAATNTNGDDAADLSDAVHLLNYLFTGGQAPVDPFPACGPGTLPTDEEMGCETVPANCR